MSPLYKSFSIDMCFLLIVFACITLTPYILSIHALPTAPLIPTSIYPALLSQNVSSVLNTTLLPLSLQDDDNWPPVPYSIFLPNTPAKILLTEYYTEILGVYETKQFLDLLIAEFEYLEKYPYQFSPAGISVARTFTDIFLTCHQAEPNAEWTYEVANEMLKMLGVMVEMWGVKGVLFDIVVAGRTDMNCKVWVDPEEAGRSKRNAM